MASHKDDTSVTDGPSLHDDAALYDEFERFQQRFNVPQDRNYRYVFYTYGVHHTEDMIKVLEDLAGRGHVESMNALGICYFVGDCVKDQTRAFELFERAATKGDTAAMVNVGTCFERGEGVAQDTAKAFQWYSRAAENGDAVAENSLGLCYEDGIGVEKRHEDGI